MRYIALALLLLYPVAADAQRRNLARQNLDRILERTMNERDDERSRPPHRADDDRRVRDHSSRWPQTHRSWWRDQRFRQRMPFGSFYAVPFTGYGFGFYPPEPAPGRYTPPREEERPIRTTGVLRLDVTPASGLQYFVDGIYLGSSSNLGTEIELTAGVRRVEVRAAGYKSLVIDVRIREGEATTFRGALEPLTQPQPPPQATGSRTMYIIPGCYIGNARPTAGELRPGCDINRLVTR